MLDRSDADVMMQTFDNKPIKEDLESDKWVGISKSEVIDSVKLYFSAHSDPPEKVEAAGFEECNNRRF